MSEIYFTSDMHIGHRRVAGLRGHWRPDESAGDGSIDFVEDMDAHDAFVADAWDSTVKERDVVIYLGDTGLGKWWYVLDWFAKRPGRKLLIMGNHDPVHPMHSKAMAEWSKWQKVFPIMVPFMQRKIEGVPVLMSHFPYFGEGDRSFEGGDRHTQWRLRDERMPLLHGHTHAKDQRAHGYQFHVGFDAWERMVTMDDVIPWVRQQPGWKPHNGSGSA